MSPILQKQAAAPVDAATKALIDEALQAAARGEVCSEEEVETDLDRIYQECLEGQEVPLPA